MKVENDKLPDNVISMRWKCNAGRLRMIHMTNLYIPEIDIEIEEDTIEKAKDKYMPKGLIGWQKPKSS